MKDIGEQKARLYAQANELAIAQYAGIIKEKGINCQFERTDAYLYSLETETALKEEAEAANRLEIHAEFVTKTELPFEIKGAVCFKNQAQFSPLEFVKAIATELDILEHT